MAIGRLITQLRRSIATGHPDLFQEIFGKDPAPTIKRYLDKFTDSTLIDLLHDFEDGRLLFAATDYVGKDQEMVLFVNGIVGHSDLLQEQVDDLSHLLQRPIVGITSAHDSALLDVANTIFGMLSFTYIMNWIVKEKLLKQLKRDCHIVLVGFGHGAIIAQHAIDLLEEEGSVSSDKLSKQLELVTFGSSCSALPKGSSAVTREHFANEHDAAAKRGCLSWAEDSEAQRGKVFVAKDSFGHMLREHYLLPLSQNPESYQGVEESTFAKRIVGQLAF
jgi:hypothetical protein